MKTENLFRHLNDTHPRHPDTPRLLEKLKQERGRIGGKRRARPFRVRRWHIAVVIVIVVAAVGGYYAFSRASSFEIVSHCGLEGTVEHYHPLLVINGHGAQVPLPYESGQSADIGYINQAGYTNPKYFCPAGQIHVLHTHDGSGIIHVELPQEVTANPTLGDFFTIWGEPLSLSQVWTHSGIVQAAVYNSDTGTSADYSSNPASIPLYEPRAGPRGNEYPIPQGLIFNGAYGTGASSGVFSGEIIWLNITS